MRALAFPLLLFSLSAVASDGRGQMIGVAGGRYAFGQVSEYRQDQYMVDTQTGRLWELVCMDDPLPESAAACVTSALQEVTYIEGHEPWGKPKKREKP